MSFIPIAVMRLAGRPLPDPNVPLLMAPVFFLLFFLPAMGEELGWSRYAVDPMQNRWGAKTLAGYGRARVSG